MTVRSRESSALKAKPTQKKLAKRLRRKAFLQVISSDYCRSWQTADLAFGRHEKNPQLSLLPFEDYTSEQVNKDERANFVAKPAAGENTVIVAHDNPLEATTVIHPDPMGIAYIITPDGNGGYTLVANVLPNEWKAL